MLKRPQKVLVIGLGNTLRGDDALGQIAAEHVEQIVDSRWVKVIRQTEPTPELAAEIAEASFVIFLDASLDGPEDDIAIRAVSPSAGPNSLAHRLDAAGLLGLSHRIYGSAPEAVSLTFRGRSFDFRDGQLSREADAACELLVQEALRQIDCHLPEFTDSPGQGECRA